MKEIMRRTLGIVLVMAVALSTLIGGNGISGMSGAKKARAVESKGKYISDLVVSYADSKEKAEAELGEDYTVLDVDLNKDLGGHAWLGYTTTDNEDEAIRDIKAMEMNGNYSISAYEKLLNDKKDIIKSQVDNMVRPLIEYAKNCDAKLPAAMETRKLLNIYYEEDSDEKMGDFFYTRGIALAADANDQSARDDIEKVYVQGNDTILQNISNILIYAQGSKVKKNGSWMTRMSALGTDGLMNVYRKAYPEKNKALLKKQIAGDFGEDAKFILEQLKSLKKEYQDSHNSDIVNALESGKTIEEAVPDVVNPDIPDEFTGDETEEEIAEIYGKTLEVMPDTVDTMEDINNECMLQVMKEVPYGEGNMYDFFMKKDLSAEDLYPMVYVLSDGQKKLMHEIGLSGVFSSTSAEYVEEGDVTENMDIDEHICSVYYGVDRDLFKGDTAITEDSLKWAATKDDPEILNDNRFNLRETIFSFALLSGIAFTGLFIHSMFAERVVEGTTTAFSKAAVESSKVAQSAISQYTKLVGSTQAMELKVLQKTSPKYGALVSKIAGTDNILKLSYAEIDRVHTQIMKEIKAESVVKLKAKVTKYEGGILKDQKWIMDRAIEQEGRVPVKYQSKVPKFGWGARIGFLLGAALSFAFVGYEIYNMVKTTEVEFTEIPSKMISRTYENDDVKMITYGVVTTASDEKADIHNKKGQQWQALYVSYDESLGDPILASSLYTTDDPYQTKAEGVTMFGESSVENLNDKNVIGKNKKDLYLFYMKGTEPVNVETKVTQPSDEDGDGDAVSGSAADTEGTVFGGGATLWSILMLLAIAIMGAGAGIWFRRRDQRR